MLWLEDFTPGRVDRFGRYEVSREESLAFARAYDPQPFHLDDAAAAANPLFGRLASSGWHTAAMAMRMTADHYSGDNERAILAGAGIDNLRWLAPVYPGDTLRCEAEILEARASASKPDRGLVRARTTVFNQYDAPVMAHESKVVVRRRPDQPAA